MFALLLISLAAQPTLGLSLQPPVGLSDAETAAVKAKVAEELGAFGLTVVDVEPVDPACVADASCVESARLALAESKDALLVVELIRVGPVIQLTATGAAGEEKMNSSHSLDEQQLASGPVLPDQVRPWAERIARTKGDGGAGGGDNGGDNGNGLGNGSGDNGNNGKKGGGLPALTPMRSGALFAGGIGILALGGGLLMVGIAEPTLEDPSSLGTDKEGARTLGFVGLAATVVGVAAVGGAAGLWFLE